VLKLQQLLLLFEIVDDLLERFLQDQNLLLENLNLLLLSEAPLFVLVGGLLLDEDVSLLVLQLRIELGLLSLIIIKSISLTHGLLSQLLVLEVDVSFDLLNIPLSILLGLQLEEVERVLLLVFHLFLHASLLDFDSVLLLLDSLF